MSEQNQEFSEQRIRHLEMIQAVVSRLGGNGFLIKGWAITVAGAFLAFAVNRQKYGLALAALAPTFLFWLLDAYFLRNERLFRHLFDRVRRGLEPPFFMAATGEGYVKRVRDEARAGKKEDVGSWFLTFWRAALVIFYVALGLTCVITAAVICHAADG
jgi:hypothetical protein